MVGSLHKRLSAYLTSAPANEETLFWFRGLLVVKLLLWQYIHAFASGGKSAVLAILLTPVAVHVVRSSPGSFKGISASACHP